MALTARPRGGEDLPGEVAAWKTAGVGVVVSLLEPSEVWELDLKAEALLCEEHEIVFRPLPIRDRGTPESAREFSVVLEESYRHVRAGTAVAIHCRAGIGRTGLFAGALLHRLGVPMAEVFRTLSQSRGVTVPDTEAQVRWVEKYARLPGPDI